MKNSTTLTRKNRLLSSSAAALAALVLAAPGLSAQDADDSEDELEEVVVTGSRIPRRDLVANSPVSVIGLEEIQLQSTVEIDRVLDALPQTVSSNGPSTNNPGNGAANVNLRNLGTVRTLVLYNGRRMVGESTLGVVDLNNIPTALIERVEVSTGGASAVYGSDAMAGVVNFITKRDFEGVQVNGQYGVTQEGDGDRFSIDATFGSNFADGRGNVTLSVGYFDRSQIAAGSREFSSVQLDEFSDGSGFFQGGSSRIPQGRFTGSGFNVFVNEAGGVTPYNGTTDAFNFAPFNNLLLPLERWTFAGTAHYDLSDNVELFTEFNYAKNRVERQLAPTPFAESGFTFDLNNPFMPTALRDLYAANDTDGDGLVTGSIFRRMLESGPRISADDRDFYRLVGGLRGNIEGFDWEVYYNYGRNDEAQRQQGNIVISRFQQGLLVDPDNPTQCLNPAGGCVVLNPFGEGNFTQEMVDYVTIAATNLTSVEQQQIGANTTGTLVDLPAGPWGIAAGIEHRVERAENNPDTFLATGDIDGFNAGLPTSGEFDVSEIYLETVVPLLSDMPFAQYLAIEGGVRFSDYSTAGGVTSYKIGGEWVPVDGVKVRGLYQRAVRAPNVQELFLGQSNSFPGATDLCNDTSDRTAEIEALCLQMGVPEDALAGFQQEDSQIEVLLGGNPDLQEETSDTFSIGLVYTPDFLPGLTVTADYYSIEIDDAIATFGGGLQSTIDACRADLDINSAFCEVLSTRRQDGQLEMVPLFNQNIARLTNKGIDWSAAYGFEALGGTFDLSVFGAYIIESTTQGSPVVAPSECEGTVGVRAVCGRADPQWRWQQRTTYRNGPFRASLRWRFIGPVTDERVVLGARDLENTFVPEIESQHYFDLTFTYDVRENLSLFTTVDNLFNREAPVFGRGAAGQFNTDSGTYDVLGRRFTFGVRANF